jgi:hypothetical protein
VGESGEYAPYLEPFTEFPFDNFPVAVVPEYDETASLLVWKSATDFIDYDNLGNSIRYGV